MCSERHGVTEEDLLRVPWETSPAEQEPPELLSLSCEMTMAIIDQLCNPAGRENQPAGLNPAVAPRGHICPTLCPDGDLKPGLTLIHRLMRGLGPPEPHRGARE